MPQSHFTLELRPAFAGEGGFFEQNAENMLIVTIGI